MLNNMGFECIETKNITWRIKIRIFITLNFWIAWKIGNFWTTLKNNIGEWLSHLIRNTSHQSERHPLDSFIEILFLIQISIQPSRKNPGNEIFKRNISEIGRSESCSLLPPSSPSSFLQRHAKNMWLSHQDKRVSHSITSYVKRVNIGECSRGTGRSLLPVIWF